MFDGISWVVLTLAPEKSGGLDLGHHIVELTRMITIAATEATSSPASTPVAPARWRRARPCNKGPVTLPAAAAACATIAWRTRAPAAITAVAVLSVTVSGIASYGAHTPIEPIAVAPDYYRCFPAAATATAPATSATATTASTARGSIPRARVDRFANRLRLAAEQPAAHRLTR